MYPDRKFVRLKLTSSLCKALQESHQYRLLSSRDHLPSYQEAVATSHTLPHFTAVHTTGLITGLIVWLCPASPENQISYIYLQCATAELLKNQVIFLPWPGCNALPCMSATLTRIFSPLLCLIHLPGFSKTEPTVQGRLVHRFKKKNKPGEKILQAYSYTDYIPV